MTHAAQKVPPALPGRHFFGMNFVPLFCSTTTLPHHCVATNRKKFRNPISAVQIHTKDKEGIFTHFHACPASFRMEAHQRRPWLQPSYPQRCRTYRHEGLDGACMYSYMNAGWMLYDTDETHMPSSLPSSAWRSGTGGSRSAWNGTDWGSWVGAAAPADALLSTVSVPASAPVAIVAPAKPNAGTTSLSSSSLEAAAASSPAAGTFAGAAAGWAAAWPVGSWAVQGQSNDENECKWAAPASRTFLGKHTEISGNIWKLNETHQCGEEVQHGAFNSLLHTAASYTASPLEDAALLAVIQAFNHTLIKALQKTRVKAADNGRSGPPCHPIFPELDTTRLW